MATATACPHCGREMPNVGNRAQHERVCYARPGIYDSVRAAAADPDKPGIAISLQRYRSIAAERGLPSYEVLKRQIGDWSQICAWLGLHPGRRHGYAPGTRPAARSREAEAFAEVDEALLYDRGVRSWVQDRGLTVLDTPRVLADGRVAWMVR